MKSRRAFRVLLVEEAHSHEQVAQGLQMWSALQMWQALAHGQDVLFTVLMKFGSKALEEAIRGSEVPGILLAGWAWKTEKFLSS